MSAATRSFPSPAGSLVCTAAAARLEATSPARAPPIPSAIANSGGSQTYASSLCLRFRPVCDTTVERPILTARPVFGGRFRAKGLARTFRRQRGFAALLCHPPPKQKTLQLHQMGTRAEGAPARCHRSKCAALRSKRAKRSAHAREARPSGLPARNAQHFERSESDEAGSDSSLEAKVGFAEADDVAGRQPLGTAEAGAVHVGAVRGADVLDPDAVATRLDACVVRGGELVVVQADVVGRTAADGERLRVQLEPVAFGERAVLQHDERAGVNRRRLPAETERGRL